MSNRQHAIARRVSLVLILTFASGIDPVHGARSYCPFDQVRDGMNVMTRSWDK